VKRALVLAVVCAGAGACAEPEDVFAYDVALRAVSDCRQTGQTTQCTQEDELDDSVLRGRWSVETRETGEFVITLEDGRVLTGLWFPNDGNNILVVPAADRPDVAVGCAGEGGTCFFARQSRDSTDTALGCLRGDELAVIFHEIEGAARGQVVTAYQTAADCSTPSAAVGIIDVDGTRAEEPSLAREVFDE
jgi:hypothetical protein